MNSHFTRRNNDLKFLHYSFYRNFDHSTVTELLKRFDHDQNAFEQSGSLLGEGRHFQSWRVYSGAGLLVLSVAKRRLGVNASDDLTLNKWQRAMAKLAQTRAVLVPPFEIVHCKGLLALALPYGNGGPEAASEHWQPLANIIADFRNQLQVRKLNLNDSEQVYCWKGIPFICDFSDLQGL